MDIAVRDLEAALTDGDPAQLAVIDAFDVDSGAAACIVGPSGGGKSTLLHVVAGIQSYRKGSVRVGDITWEKNRPSARDRLRARHVAYLFQTYNLLPQLTAKQNVMLALGFAGKPSSKAAATAEEWLDRVDLRRARDRPARALSVGERQRAALARALAVEPAVLLADEPTAHLDPARRDDLLTMMVDLLAEKRVTAVVVTHDPEVARRFEDRRSIDDIVRFEPMERSA